MSDDLMQVPANAFVPSPESAAAIAAAIAAVRNTEGERRWNLALGRMGGWIVAAIMVVPLGYAMSIVKNQPVPKDRIWIAMMHEDGSTVEAKPVEDMTLSQTENTITQFMFDYVQYRVSYNWQTVQRNYDRTRFVTYGDAQKEYVHQMTEAPDRDTEALGKSGEKRVDVTEVTRIGPHAFSVAYTLKIKMPEGNWMPDIRRRAEISYGTFEGLPAEIARRLDPLKAVVIGWDDHPAAFDPTAVGGKK